MNSSHSCGHVVPCSPPDEGLHAAEPASKAALSTGEDGLSVGSVPSSRKLSLCTFSSPIEGTFRKVPALPTLNPCVEVDEVASDALSPECSPSFGGYTGRSLCRDELCVGSVPSSRKLSLCTFSPLIEGTFWKVPTLPTLSPSWGYTGGTHSSG